MLHLLGVMIAAGARGTGPADRAFGKIVVGLTVHSRGQLSGDRGGTNVSRNHARFSRCPSHHGGDRVFLGRHPREKMVLDRCFMDAHKRQCPKWEKTRSIWQGRSRHGMNAWRNYGQYKRVPAWPTISTVSQLLEGDTVSPRSPAIVGLAPSELPRPARASSAAPARACSTP